MNRWLSGQFVLFNPSNLLLATLIEPSRNGKTSTEELGEHDYGKSKPEYVMVGEVVGSDG